MQDKTVNVRDTEMFERAGERLRHLSGQWGCRIIREAMVLAGLVGELGLEEEIIAADQPGAISSGKTLADSGFKIVAALVGGVNGAKAGADGQFRESGGTIFFPCGAIEKIGNRRRRHATILTRQCSGGGKTMVYAIAQLKITDRAAYDRYQAKFMGVMKKHKGRVLAADEKPAVVEGAWDREKVVLLEFPDEASFREWAESPEYVEIAKDRKAGSDAVVLLVKGIGGG